MYRTHFPNLCLAAILLSACTAAGIHSSAVAINSSPSSGARAEYNIVIVGDTHFDTEPETVYHSNYNEPTEWLNKVQRAEFARNGEMWKDKCPRLIKRAYGLTDRSTAMVIQAGDLIQGDCGDGEVHKKMLDDAMNMLKESFGGLPFVTVEGNHDLRGTDAQEAYNSYMPQRLSRELGVDVGSTTFSFFAGPDVYLFVDFNNPDEELIMDLLQKSDGARHTFVVSHGPIFPYDGSSCRWFLFGGADKASTEARLRLRKALAARDAIVICGHTHRTEFIDWYGDGGHISQITTNSVWKNDKCGVYAPDSEGAEMYGTLRAGIRNDDGSALPDEMPLFDEYRPGIRTYVHSLAAGSYKMTVTAKHVYVDFYVGDSSEMTARFKMK